MILSIVIGFFLALILVILYVIFLIKKYWSPFMEAIMGVTYCKNNPGKCELVYNEGVPEPTVKDLENFSWDASYYCINKVSQVFTMISDDEIYTLQAVKRGTYKYCDKWLFPRLLGSESPWLQRSKPLANFYNVNGSLLIAVRGTYSPEEVLKDIDYTHRTFMDTKVHHGFLDVYLSVKDELNENIKSYIDQGVTSIVFAGHSLGGVISLYCACELRESYPDITITCYTYGMPKPGNSEFIKLAHNSVNNIYQLVNDADQITMFPFSCSPNFAESSGPLEYNMIEKGVYRFQLNRNSMWLNHSVRTYQDFVSQKIDSSKNIIN